MIDKIAWLHLQNGSVLSARSRGKDRFYFAGGKRETGETDTQALVREIKEELTVTLNPTTLSYVGTFEAQAHGHATGVMVRMTCYQAQYEGQLQPAAEIEEIAWLTYQDRHRVSAVDQIIFDWLRKRQLLAD